MHSHVRHIPRVRNKGIRTAIGLIFLVLSTAVAVASFNKGHIVGVMSINTIAWTLAVFITDKYAHKYPQRYYTYLVASHLKSGIIMAVFLGITGGVAGPIAAPSNVLWTGYAIFVLSDALASVPGRRDISKDKPHALDKSLGRQVEDQDRFTTVTCSEEGGHSIVKQRILKEVRSDLDGPFLQFLENSLPDFLGSMGGVLILDDIPDRENDVTPVGFIVGRTRMNDVRRLNHFLQFCSDRIPIGGYFITRYMPYENFISGLKDRYRYPGPLYWAAYILHSIWYRAIPKIPWLDRIYFSRPFSWVDAIHLSLVKRRNRALSRAEAWGRLSFWGMRVLSESNGDGELFIIAQRVSAPVHNKIPSYYVIASLEKVGLDGEIIRTHKIRTMYPFSEFIQQRIYQEHGLEATGKFANDFRLTGYGRFLRKYWLDELPQILDWLRGDIKLVGIRATSPQFLSLYPREFYAHYIQIKPGLIPPVFDESTDCFDEIVKVEFAYLMSYQLHPIRTDVRYLCKTFTDIVFRGVRSK